MLIQMNSYQNKNKKISINNVSKSYDGIKILDNISMDVYEGEFVSILGPSGCGKSTLFNLICNLTKIDNGDININGKISYMYQKDLLLPYKTIIDNVALPLILNKKSKKEAKEMVNPYLEVFGLSGYENKYPNELSGGMKQRANFLRTYINSDDIMLLDEPFGALDSITKLSMQYQKDLLLPYKTIIDNVALPLILNKKSKKEAKEMVNPYLEVFGLSGYENKYPNELSGGMKQRANFLRTYINSDDIMLLDEPFGALDSITKLSMQRWLLEVKSKVNSTIILITHDIDEAIMLSNRIEYMLFLKSQLA